MAKTWRACALTNARNTTADTAILRFCGARSGDPGQSVSPGRLNFFAEAPRRPRLRLLWVQLAVSQRWFERNLFANERACIAPPEARRVRRAAHWKRADHAPATRGRHSSAPRGFHPTAAENRRRFRPDRGCAQMLFPLDSGRSNGAEQRRWPTIERASPRAYRPPRRDPDDKEAGSCTRLAADLPRFVGRNGSPPSYRTSRQGPATTAWRLARGSARSMDRLRSEAATYRVEISIGSDVPTGSSGDYSGYDFSPRPNPQSFPRMPSRLLAIIQSLPKHGERCLSWSTCASCGACAGGFWPREGTVPFSLRENRDGPQVILSQPLSRNTVQLRRYGVVSRPRHQIDPRSPNYPRRANLGDLRSAVSAGSGDPRRAIGPQVILSRPFSRYASKASRTVQTRTANRRFGVLFGAAAEVGHQ